MKSRRHLIKAESTKVRLLHNSNSLFDLTFLMNIYFNTVYLQIL